MDRDRGIWLCLMEWLKIWMKVLNLIQSHLKACRFSHRKYVKIVFYKDQADEYGLVWFVFCYCVTHYYKLSSLKQPKFYHSAVSVGQESMWAWFGSLIRLSQGHSWRWSDWTLIWRLCRGSLLPSSFRIFGKFSSCGCNTKSSFLTGFSQHCFPPRNYLSPFSLPFSIPKPPMIGWVILMLWISVTSSSATSRK